MQTFRRISNISKHITKTYTKPVATNSAARMPELHEQTGDDWSEMAKIYKQLTVGVNSRPIEAILTRLDQSWPFTEATGILDNGCGPGPIISRLLNEYGSKIPESCTLRAADFSAPMIEQVNNSKKERISEEPNSPWNRVETAVLNAMDLQGIADDSMSHITAGWVYFMTPDPQKCLSESKRVLKTGGVLGCSSWKGSQWLEIMGLVKEVRPDKDIPKLPKEWSDVDLLHTEMDKAGFREVESMEVEVEMTLDSYDAFIHLMTDTMPHMIALLKDFSAEEKEKLKEVMLAKTKEFVPSVPGKLHGTALVAIGKK